MRISTVHSGTWFLFSLSFVSQSSLWIFGFAKRRSLKANPCSTRKAFKSNKHVQSQFPGLIEILYRRLIQSRYGIIFGASIWCWHCRANKKSDTACGVRQVNVKTSPRDFSEHTNKLLTFIVRMFEKPTRFTIFMMCAGECPDFNVVHGKTSSKLRDECFSHFMKSIFVTRAENKSSWAEFNVGHDMTSLWLASLSAT